MLTRPKATRPGGQAARRPVSFSPRVGAASLLVGPVELVEDPVAVLEAEVDAFRLDVEVPLATVTALPDEPMLQNDGGEMVLAGDGVLERRAPCLAHTRDAEPAVPSSSMSTSARTTPATSKVVPRIDHGSPPSCPVKIGAKHPSFSSVTAGGTTKTALPLPSWMAFGQSMMATALISFRVTSPQWPSAMCTPTAALQEPSGDVGNPEKLHVQPGWQLQNS